MACTSCYNRSCPEPVSVAITQTFLTLNDDTAVVDVYKATVTGASVTLPYSPLSAFVVKVWINGLLQDGTQHYTVVDKAITFTSALAGDDVQVEYAHLVP